MDAKTTHNDTVSPLTRRGFLEQFGQIGRAHV